jgi:hypothetical protein
MTYYSEILNIKSDFEKKAEAVKKNRDLSDRGREKALAALKAEKDAALKSFVKPLREQAVKTALKVKQLDGALSALGELEAAQFDYSRLAYMAQATRSQLTLCKGDPFLISEAWNRVKNSKDRYAIKSWLDVVPATFPEDGGNRVEEWQTLKADMADNQNLVRTPEASRYEQEKKNHMAELAEIARDTGVIGDEVGKGGYQTQNLIKRVFSGIAIDRESGELIVELGPVANESPDTVIDRLEAEHAAKVKVQAEFAARFGTELDPDLDID